MGEKVLRDDYIGHTISENPDWKYFQHNTSVQKDFYRIEKYPYVLESVSRPRNVMTAESYLGKGLGQKCLYLRPNQYFYFGVYQMDITIDEYCIRRRVVLDIIKMDIEGGEYNALISSSKILKNCKNIKIIMEVWYKPLPNITHIKAVKLLNNYDFSPFKIDMKGNLFAYNNLLSDLRSKFDERNQNENILFLKNVEK